jgi:hypothetical protein
MKHREGSDPTITDLGQAAPAARDGCGAAALAAVGILMWNLARTGLIETQTLALELARYARLHDDEPRTPGDAAAAQSLYALANLVRGAGRLRDRPAARRPARPLAESVRLG